MTPILAGIVASGISGHLTPPVTDFGIMEPIATAVVGSGNALYVEFTNIPQTYKHLQVRASSRYAGNDGGYTMYFNNDTNAGNYRAHLTNGAQMQDGFIVWSMANNSKVAGSFNGSIIDIYDYRSTTKTKTAKCLNGYDADGSGVSQFSSTLWFATPAAITSIKFDARAQGSTSDFAQYMRFDLYGIKES